MEPDAAVRLARRYVWWREPAETLADLRHLLQQIMALGRPEDYRTALQLWGTDAFVDALESAPAGAMDDRSWYFWRRHFNLAEVPPPLRCFDDATPCWFGVTHPLGDWIAGTGKQAADVERSPTVRTLGGGESDDARARP